MERRLSNNSQPLGQVAFSRELHVSLNLLGRQDCFQHFFIIFDEVAQEVIFIPREESDHVIS